MLEAIKKHPDIDSFMLDEEYISKNLATSRPELMTFSFVNNKGGEYADILPESVSDAARDIDYKSFGLDMGVIPSFKTGMTWIIPFVSFLLQIAVTIVAQYFQKKNNPAARNMGMGMKAIFIIMPLFSLWIGFSYPAGLGLYWCYSSLFALLQTIVLNVIYNPEKIQAMIEAENEKNKKTGKKSRFAKMAEQNLERMGKSPYKSDDDDEDEDTEEKKLSKAEKAAEDRRKIAAARKRMAEKYGEEYQEFADEEEEEEKPKPQSGSKKKKKKNNNNSNNNKNNGENKAENTDSEEPAESEDNGEENTDGDEE